MKNAGVAVRKLVRMLTGIFSLMIIRIYCNNNAKFSAENKAFIVERVSTNNTTEIYDVFCNYFIDHTKISMDLSQKAPPIIWIKKKLTRGKYIFGMPMKPIL